MVGLLAAGCMGSVLGLLGAGGSLMTVPILVYLFNVPAVLATSYSLLVVGFTSSLAVIQYQREKMVKWKTAVLFSLPSMAGVGLTRKFVVPAIPERIPVPIFGEILKGQLILLVFAVLVIVVASIMIKDSRKRVPINEPKSVEVSADSSAVSEVKLGKKLWLIPLEGLVVGAVTGFVGAGGGFLIVPALIYLAGLGVQEAVATSLVIIAAKSLFGFAIDLNIGYAIDWSLMAWFCVATSVGVVVGVGLNKRVAPDSLKRAFAWFILAIGIVMVVKELVV